MRTDIIITIIIIVFPCHIFPVFTDSYVKILHVLKKRQIFRENKSILAFYFLPNSAATVSGSGTLRFWERRRDIIHK